MIWFNIFKGKEICKVWLNYLLIPTFDGVGCAVLAKFAFGTNAVDIEYCNYDDVDKKVERYFDSGVKNECHITDISISEELASKINDGDEMFFQLLDHHATALNLNEFYWCTVEVENKNGIKTSGTELYYNWLVDNNYLIKDKALDRFVELVRNYDTWRWTTLGDEGIICKQINDLFHLYNREKFIDWCLTEIYDDSFPYLDETAKVVLEIEQGNIDAYVKKKNEQMLIMPLCNLTCGVVFAERYFSELGNRLCEMHPEIDFVAMISMNGTVSYRTVKDDIDLGKDVAKMFGGGGHAKAAGSSFTNGVQLDIINKIFS